MKFLDNLAPHAHWLLRVALAGVFLFHGIGKFPNLPGMTEMLQLPVYVVFLVALAETVGCALVLVGGFLKDWMTRLGALMMTIVIVGAIVMFHWGRWSFVPSESHPMGGMEFQVTLLLILVYFLIKGNNGKRGVAAA